MGFLWLFSMDRWFDTSSILKAITQSDKEMKEGQTNMLTQRLYPTQQAFHRSQRMAVLSLTDVGVPILLGLAACPLPTDIATLPACIWVMAAWVSWGMLRGRDAGLRAYRYHESASMPLLALALSLILLPLIGVKPPTAFLATVSLGWGVTLFAARFILRRSAPALVVGILPGFEPTLPQGPEVRYVFLSAPTQVALQDLDGLLIDPTQPLPGGWVRLMMHVQAVGIPIYTAASLREELSGRVSVDDKDLHDWCSTDVPFQSSYLWFKGLFDRVMTLLALGLLLPLAAVVALVVLLDSGRPILFWQERVGLGGRLFGMVKFRTMVLDSEQVGAAFAAAGDARVTRVGRFLRKFRLDELPQFWNVLRGEMSIIGPRPEQHTFVEQFNREIQLYPVRHWVRPGITGWAQVKQGYAASTDATVVKLCYDMYYIKYISFWLDVRILVKTLVTILTGFGAR